MAAPPNDHAALDKLLLALAALLGGVGGLSGLAAWLKARAEARLGEKRLELSEEESDAKTAAELRNELRQDIRDLRSEVSRLRERVSVLESEVKAKDADLAAKELALQSAALHASEQSARILELERVVADRTGERDTAQRERNDALVRLAELERDKR